MPPRVRAESEVRTPSPVPSAVAVDVADAHATRHGTPTTVARTRASHAELGGYGDGLVFIDGDGNADWELPRLMPRLMHRRRLVAVPRRRRHENADRFGVQQAVVELSPSPAFGVHAGLLLLPLGIINQTNELPTYLSVDRPLTDQLIIPTIWRELGAGIFGELAAPFASSWTSSAG